MSKYEAVALFVFAALFLTNYSRTLFYEPVWDDHSAILENSKMQLPLGEAILTTQLEQHGTKYSSSAFDSFRPVTFTSHWLDINFFGASSFWMHLHNLLWAMLFLGLGFFFFLKILGSFKLATVGLMILGLHPVMVESFSYISARADLVASSLALACSVALLHFAPRSQLKAVLASTAFFVLALLSKESVIFLPIALFFVLWPLKKLTQAWRPLLTLFVISILYFLFRSFLFDSQQGLFNLSYVAPRIAGVWLQYLMKAVLPISLGIDEAFQESLLAKGWIVLGLLTLIYFVSAFSKRLRWIATVLSGLAWSFVLIIPMVVPSLAYGNLANRYITLPLLGLCLTVLFSAKKLKSLRPGLVAPSLILGSFYLAFFAVVSVQQTSHWRNDFALVRHNLETFPQSAMAIGRFGMILDPQQHPNESIELLEEAIKREPFREVFRLEIAKRYEDMGKTDQAIEHLEQIVERPGIPPVSAVLQLVELLMKHQQMMKACFYLEQVVKTQPHLLDQREIFEQNCQK